MTTEPRRVVVTGLGATTPVGGDVPSTWEGLLAGRSGVRTLEDERYADLPVRFAGQAAVDPSEVMERPEARKLDRSQQLALIASREAWKDAGSPEIDPLRLGVAVATGIGGIVSLLDNYDILNTRGWTRVSPMSVPQLMPNGSAAWVGLDLGAQAGIHTPVSACASGAEAVGTGLEMIRSGRADVVMTGGTEACIHPITIAAFGAMRALSTRNDDPATASRPYDLNRDGFVMGEGAGMLVLEEYDHAVARGATIYAEVAGVGLSADGHHIAQPEPEGRGATRAIRSALEASGLAASDIIHVNAHATLHAAGRRRRGPRDPRRPRQRHRRHRRERHQVDDGPPPRRRGRGRVGRGDPRAAPPRRARHGQPAGPRRVDRPRRRLRQPAHAARRRRRRAQQLVRVRRPQRRPHLPEHLMTAVAGSDVQVTDLDPRHPLVRLEAFLDDGTMELISAVDDCGVIAATGVAHGTRVVVFCTDPTVQGGAMGIGGCKVIVQAYERASADGVPIVGLWHSGGARLREGVESLQAVGLVFAIMTRVSGRIRRSRSCSAQRPAVRRTARR